MQHTHNDDIRAIFCVYVLKGNSITDAEAEREREREIVSTAKICVKMRE